MEKIGVIGVGIVGTAVLEGFNKLGANVCGYDKYKEIGSIDEVLKTNAVFLCLPTLYSDKLKEYDKSAIHDVCEMLSENRYKGMVIIKSTVEPTTTANLSAQYSTLRFLHNPEFLTARTNLEDFLNQNHIVIGKTASDSDAHELEKFYGKLWPMAKISIASSTETEMMKISVNSFYATKIMFFNELYLMSQTLGADYKKVRNMMLMNGWINPMHTDVPGTDGKMAYGGACFPKDTQALYHFMQRENLSARVLGAAIKECGELRDCSVDELSHNLEKSI